MHPFVYLLSQINRKEVLMFRNNQEVLLGGLYNEWMSNLLAYTEQLDNVEANINQLLYTVVYGENEVFLRYLKTETTQVKACMKTVLEEVESAAQQFKSPESGTIHVTVGEMMLRNRLRDKIRKLEQTTFLLKYRLNQYLSKVS